MAVKYTSGDTLIAILLLCFMILSSFIVQLRLSTFNKVYDDDDDDDIFVYRCLHFHCPSSSSVDTIVL